MTVAKYMETHPSRPGYLEHTAVVTSAGPASADKLPALDATGRLDPSVLPAVGGAVFIADGQTGIVASNGTVVMAGANAIVSVAAGITTFVLAEWQTQTAWTAGNTPTISQAGTASHPSLPARLAAADGDEITVARDPGGVTWFVTSPVSGAEVGEGSVLPANGSGVELFRLTGNLAGLPDGLYTWTQPPGVWIQA